MTAPVVIQLGYVDIFWFTALRSNTARFNVKTGLKASNKSYKISCCVLVIKTSMWPMWTLTDLVSAHQHDIDPTEWVSTQLSSLLGVNTHSHMMSIYWSHRLYLFKSLLKSKTLLPLPSYCCVLLLLFAPPPIFHILDPSWERFLEPCFFFLNWFFIQ